MVVTDCYTVLDDDGSAPVLVSLRMTQAEADDLVAAYRPGQTPEMLADPARVVAVPVAAAIAELVRP